jgi:hypothetical protein
MKRTARVLLAVSILGFSAVATSGSALAGGALGDTGGLPTPQYPWGFGYGYAHPAYDSYVFAYEYPVYTGHDVTAIAVDLVNSRFRHRRVVGPGVVYYRSKYPNPYW